MRVAIPTTNGLLCPHFGHCKEFTLIGVHETSKTIRAVDAVPAPAHQPGMLPKWLANQGASVILAGGIGQRAIALFNDAGITVRTGVPEESPQQLVMAYLDGSLKSVDNTCDNTGHHHGDGQCGRH